VSPRLAAIVLVTGALLLHLLLARPAWHEAAVAEDQVSRLRLEKRKLETEINAHERALARGRRAVRMVLPADAPTDAVGRLRRSLLESVRDQPASGVRLAVFPARPPLLAEGRLRAEGSFADMVRLSGRLLRPGAGLVLSQVRFSPTQKGGVTLEVVGVSVAEGEGAGEGGGGGGGESEAP
jgi:hypothetical protein